MDDKQSRSEECDTVKKKKETGIDVYVKYHADNVSIEYLIPRIAIKKSNILFLIVDGDNMALEMCLYHRSSRSIQLYSLFAHTMRQLMMLPTIDVPQIGANIRVIQLLLLTLLLPGNHYC
ncbi:hypothetical protein WUBG_11209 [Wuchereria bancrofti]|uniref:Uncharacterized protein n=1 Tax=Wuchereria bancrofti TaxID=6293 RepID=J9ATU8_WUCBA|nr:hypothetical protein WUBG_11209 [Wuchereria bancrofti]